MLIWGDVLDRVRRPVYAVVLLAAVGLGYLAAPMAGSHWTIVDVGGYRGVYNSAYIGVVTALAGSLWLTLGGFYVVRDGIQRDARTGVGELLAATPLRNVRYLAGKFAANLLLLASMLAALAVTSVVMQLARGESYAVDPVALLKPFVLVALPLLALTAAFALLFESVPLLRGGIGNIVWFCVSLVVMLGGQSAALGAFGVHPVVRSLAEGVRTKGEFSLGLTYVDRPLRTFEWHGAALGWGFTGARLLLVAVAVAVAVLPALWFGRFDPARGVGRAAPVGQAVVHVGGAGFAFSGLTAVARGSAAGRLLVGETRILLRGVSRWWWLVVGGISAAALAAPVNLLPVLWVLPVLIWSRLGAQRTENGLDGLLAAYPAASGRMWVEWLSGVALTAACGLAPLVRLAVSGDWDGVGGWAGGVLFVPALALALGTLTRTHRAFQALYLPLWYAAVNGIGAFDYMGTCRPLVFALTAGLLLTTFVIGAFRRSRR
ncbi:hypothetical protein [Streptosporangium minutum]|uniref:Uncharacterized protein n=1 Tax=Streptosporangium minutum TaxID=569862 RepID=A0A243RL76_9ACTN|nr:hypothetical protein CA984_18210 [Streptosporangium minutum]